MVTVDLPGHSAVIVTVKFAAVNAFAERCGIVTGSLDGQFGSQAFSSVNSQ